jgi:hypothetical protein
MSIMKKISVLGLILFFLSAAAVFTAGAESFRVHDLVPVTVSADMTPVVVSAGINDAISLNLPKDMTFLRGIELAVKIPRDIAEWRDSIAYSLYNNIKPVPSEKKIDYTGDRISVGTFPGRLSLTIYIPLTEDNGIKDSPYSVKIGAIPETKNGFVFFRMQLAMKGVPESMEKAVFEITVKPLLIDKGKLHLDVSEPAAESPHPYTVYLDDEPFDEKADGRLFDTGEHHLSVASEFYRSEVRSFRIDQAKTTKLSIALRNIAPSVRITAPENTSVFFDEAKLGQYKDPFTVTPGDHTIKFVIGDYEVVKTVSAVNGRSYTVSLSVDASVTEDE